MKEEELTRIAAKLGEDPASRLDEDRVAATVLARLASEPAKVVPIGKRIGWGLLGLAAAAALVLAVIQRASPSAHLPATPSVLTELDDLNASELEQLLEVLPPAAAATGHSEGTSLDELDTRSLERLLRSLEG